MGNYRQHLAFASTLGLLYSLAAFLLAGLHWLYGSVAILLATLGGLLPDLDSPSGVELKGFTGILGVLCALIVWQEVGQIQPSPVFELHLWAVIGTYLLIRYGLSRIVGHVAVHRGISHSFPTLLVWSELVYLYYPSDSHILRIVMGLAVGLGFLSHLLLDEICSVDLKGVRLNKAFGTAMKLWAPSALSTLFMYGILTFLTNEVIQQWPDASVREAFEIRLPDWPSQWPKPKWLEGLLRSGSEPTPSRSGEPIKPSRIGPLASPRRESFSRVRP